MTLLFMSVQPRSIKGDRNKFNKLKPGMDPSSSSQKFQARSSPDSYSHASSTSAINATVRKMNGQFHQLDERAESWTAEESGDIHGETRVKRSLQQEFFAAANRMENSTVRSFFNISLFDSVVPG